ncbi:hypothetical protein ES703_19638 [subsurface metagenome]
MAKRVYRSRKNCWIAGICGGIAEYFDIDPILVRIIAVCTISLNGLGLIAYIIAWILIPQNPEPLVKEEISKKKGGLEKMKEKAEKVAHEIGEGIRGESERTEHKRHSRWIGGLILICLGLLFLARNFFHWFDLGKLWPLILVIIGLAVMAGRLGGKKEK